jgi:superfamily II DNA or RNA helicase
MKVKSNPAQAEVIKQILKDTNKRIILNYYTGGGKTHIALSIIAEKLKRNPNIKIGVSCFLQTNIKNQTYEYAKNYLKKSQYTVVNAGEEIDTSANVFFFNPQSLYRRKLPFLFDMFFIDEVHIGLGIKTKMINSIITDKCRPDVTLIGKSATSWDVELLPIFEGASVYRRGMDRGFQDGRIASLRFRTEHFDIQLDESCYDAEGDLTLAAQRKYKKELERMCKTKLEKLMSTYDLGAKCVVKVPPGDNCGLVKYVMGILPERALYLTGQNSHDEKNILARFANDPNINFLVVVAKCSVGFDMPSLISVVDLSLSRNIKVLLQFLGRAARFYMEGVVKNFFYVFDARMSKAKMEWILNTLAKFSTCDYSGYAGDIFKMPTKIQTDNDEGEAEDEDVLLEDILFKIKSSSMVNCRDVSFFELSRKRGGFYEEKKPILIAMMKAGEPKPKTKDPLYNAHAYLKNNDSEYQAILVTLPSWADIKKGTSYREHKTILIAMMKAGKPKPKSGDPLYVAHQKLKNKDPEYKAILVTYPSWTSRKKTSYEEQKPILINMMKTGKPKPKSSDLLYGAHLFLKNNDSEYQAILVTYPSWADRKSYEEQKTILLAMLKTGNPKPKAEDPLYQAHKKLKNKDPEYKAILVALPSRASRNHEEKKHILIAMMKAGKPKPTTGDLYRAHMYLKEKNSEYQAILVTYPSWADRKSYEEQKPILINMMKTGKPKPTTGDLYRAHRYLKEKNSEYQAILVTYPSWANRKRTSRRA